MCYFNLYHYSYAFEYLYKILILKFFEIKVQQLKGLEKLLLVLFLPLKSKDILNNE